jgi:hypothetical protein
MLETNANSERLQRSYNELVELQLVLEKVRGWGSLPAAVAALRTVHSRHLAETGIMHKHCTQQQGLAPSVCSSLA